MERAVKLNGLRFKTCAETTTINLQTAHTLAASFLGLLWIKRRILRGDVITDLLEHYSREVSQFLDLLLTGDLGFLVNASASLGTEFLELIDDRSIILDRQLQRFDRLEMRAATLGNFITGCLERRARGLKRCVIRGDETPVVVHLAVSRRFDIAPNYPIKFLKLVARRYVAFQMSVGQPVVEAHLDPRLERPFFHPARCR